MKTRSTWRVAKGWRRGQSVTEFAIMVPVIVLILWMSIYLSEVIHVRLRMMEIARFATWEYTAQPLHDYDEGTGSRFDDVEPEVTELTLQLYEDLDSSDTGEATRDRSEANTMLATGWILRDVSSRDGAPPNLTGDVIGELALSVVLSVEAWIESLLTTVENPMAAQPTIWTISRLPTIDRRWGFNTRGWITTTVRADVYNIMTPTRFRQLTPLEFEQDRWVRPTIHLRETSALLCDTWRLNDGADVQQGDDEGGYYEQVNRIFLLNRGQASLLVTGLTTTASLTNVLTAQSVPSATDPVVVSLNHHEEEDGRIELQVDDGRETFDTAPLTVPHPRPEGEGSGTWTPYQETLDNRGEYFMGCEEPMNASCGSGLGTENPFGDGVHWPPPSRGGP